MWGIRHICSICRIFYRIFNGHWPTVLRARPEKKKIQAQHVCISPSYKETVQHILHVYLKPSSPHKIKPASYRLNPEQPTQNLPPDQVGRGKIMAYPWQNVAISERNRLPETEPGLVIPVPSNSMAHTNRNANRRPEIPNQSPPCRARRRSPASPRSPRSPPVPLAEGGTDLLAPAEMRPSPPPPRRWGWAGEGLKGSGSDRARDGGLAQPGSWISAF